MLLRCGNWFRASEDDETTSPVREVTARSPRGFLLRFRCGRRAMGWTRTVACVGPSARIKNRPVPPRGLKSQARATQRITNNRDCGLSRANRQRPLPVRQHDPGDKHSAASDGFFSAASRNSPCRSVSAVAINPRMTACRKRAGNYQKFGSDGPDKQRADQSECDEISLATYFPISRSSSGASPK